MSTIRLTRTLSLLIAGVTAAALTLAGGLVAQPAAGAPGSPGTPGDYVVVYQEDFENVPTGLPTILTSYVSDVNGSYTADAPWLRACNGVVVSRNMPDSALPMSGCTLKSAAENADAYSSLRQLAYALGIQGGVADPSTNHAVSAYTDGQNPGANLREFATVTPIALPPTSGSRYLTMQVDAAAESCWASSPLYNFFAVQPDGTNVQVGSTINMCTDASNRLGAIWYDSYTLGGSFLFNGNSVGIVMRNANGSGSGNDAAFDNIRLLDVTPQLDKSFSPGLVGTNQPSRMTFTVTNTTELASKAGFSFTDNLPAGLVIAPTPNFSSTCAPASITAGGTPGATTVSYQGSLVTNQVSCTFDIDVVSASEGTYVNAPDTNVTSLVGLLAPLPATLVVRDPRIQLTKALTADRHADTDQFDVQVHVGAPGGPVLAGGVPVSTGTGAVVTSGTGTTGELHATTGTTYYLSETGVGTTAPGSYDATVTCVDENGIQQDLPVDAAQPVAITPLAGADINCTISNQPLNPSIALVKSVALGTDLNGDAQAGVGDTLAYSFLVSNTGDVPLTDISVADQFVAPAGPAITVSCPVTTLAVGEDTTCTGSVYVVTLDDAEQGVVDNSATATGAPPLGSNVISPPSTTSTPIVTIAPGISILKSVALGTDLNGDGLVGVGDTLDYSFLVTNTGDVALSNVSVADQFVAPAGPALTVDCPSSTLSVGENMTCTADSYVVTAADAANTTVDNSATASGTPPFGSDVTSPPSTTTTPVIPAAPAITIVKSVALGTDLNGDGSVGVGDTLDYSFLVTNTGDVPLTDISVADQFVAPAGPAITVSCPVTTLAVGEDTTCTGSVYVVTLDDAEQGVVDNSATATGAPPLGSNVISPPSTTSTPIVTIAPGISILKSVALGTDLNGDGLVGVGDTLDYSFLVTNTGDVALSNVSVADQFVAPAGPALTVDCPSSTLSVGENMTCTADSYVVTAADAANTTVDNSATASGTPPFGPGVTSPPSNTTTEVIPVAPAITIVKSVTLGDDANSDGKAGAGDSLLYSFLVTNTGDVELTHVTVADVLAAPAGPALTVDCPQSHLEVGESMTCTASTYVVTDSDVAHRSVDNTATATGTPPVGPEVTSPPSSTTTPTVPTPTTISPAGPPGPATRSGLASTGSTGITDVLLFGGALLAVGAILIAIRRRRHGPRLG